MKVVLSIHNPKVPLRHIIGMRQEMEQHGQKIIQKLLESSLLLLQDAFYLRRIQPSTIMLNEDYTELVFADIRNAITKQDKNSETEDFFFPYDAGALWEFHKVQQDCPMWDEWSIGITILEIIIGTELVVMCTNYPDVKLLVETCSEYIDKDTCKVIKLLLSMEDEGNIEDYLNAVLKSNPILMAENIRAINSAISEEPLLHSTRDKFWEEHRQKLQEHSVKYCLDVEKITKH